MLWQKNEIAPMVNAMNFLNFNKDF